MEYFVNKIFKNPLDLAWASGCLWFRLEAYRSELSPCVNLFGRDELGERGKVAATVCSMMFSLRVISITQTFDPHNGGGSGHKPCYQQNVLILNLATVCPWPSNLIPVL